MASRAWMTLILITTMAACSASETVEVRPDGGKTSDSGTSKDDAETPRPDAGLLADAGEAPPDARSDAAEPTPDAAEPTPDAAEPTPDAAEPTPDAAEPTPDAAEPTPDAAEPTPDAAEPTPDAEVDGGAQLADAGAPTTDGGVPADASAVMDASAAMDAGASAADAGGPSGCCTGASWNVTSGLGPTDVCVPWTLRDNAAASPTLDAAGVRLVTAVDSENMSFGHAAPVVAAGTTVRMRFRMQLLSSAAAASWRSGAGVLFAFGPGHAKNSLYIAPGEIFLLAAENTRGMALAVPTTDAMHDYVIEVNTTTGAIAVSYDGTPALTGAMFVTPGDTVQDAISWGDISSFARGDSRWASFEHDAWSGCSSMSWAASELLLPSADCPTWTAIDTAPTNPSLAAAALTLTTSANAENMGYSAQPVSAGSLVRMRFRMQLISSVTAAPWRSGAAVAFTFGPLFRKNTLYIGPGEIFLLSAENTRGQAATVATTDAMHDYQIDVDTVSGAITVLRDGAAAVSGTMFTTPGDTTTDRVLWGDISSVAYGTSAWASFSHDALSSCGP